MSKARAAHQRANEAAFHASPARETPSPAGPAVPPMKPRRALFWLLAAALVLLAGGMLALYFKTVYPYRYAPHAVEDDKPNPAAVGAR